MPPPARRVADLLISPRETLDVEFKGWLDIVNDGDHKAVLAKALIGLANHGGGFFVFGFAETPSGLVAATPRPADLRAYTSDTVNSVVSAYAEPVFHCEVSIVPDPSGAQYPIVTVPGGHRAPIKARRDGPKGQIVKQNSYYIRRAGPQSEIPQNGREWDALIHRCMMNAREDMLATV